jgi:hypothetical protein
MEKCCNGSRYRLIEKVTLSNKCEWPSLSGKHRESVVLEKPFCLGVDSDALTR